MKRNITLKKSLITSLLVSLLFLGLFCILHRYESRTYTAQTNRKLISILKNLPLEDEELTDLDLIKLIDSPMDPEMDTFCNKFGIRLDRDILITKNTKQYTLFFIGQVLILGLLSLSLVGIFLRYNRKKDRELQKITDYMEQLNQRNYKLEIDDMSEDELSILKSEIYKTTVMLKETAEHSIQDKNLLKDSLSDISHQLKTPLTSILVILDNLIDHPDMDTQTRIRFIRDIKREISNIQFLVQSLLKLSKLESNTVTFLEKKISTREILEQAIQNVSILCDLKDIQIQNPNTEDYFILCDERWQVEAVTNILKNCIEHSFHGERIDIERHHNQIYASISIRDYGTGIDEEDQRHLFERFYRGKNASYDSCGIGLSLAKAIAEANNGSISVDSHSNGTTFTIKYYSVAGTSSLET